MTLRICLIVGILLLPGTSTATREDPPKVLFAYGPGGPHRAMQECAERFGRLRGIRVEVLNARPTRLPQRLAEHGDLYFAGAEYMLQDFERENPGLLDLSSTELIHPRRLGLIVREGNPLGISGTGDLPPGIDLLVADLERVDLFHPPGPDGDHRHHRVQTGRQGVETWRARPELDAWLTYRSWHVALGEGEVFIEIPHGEAVRQTPVAPTKRTPHREHVLEFIDYLKSQEARAIFEEHGWY